MAQELDFEFAPVTHDAWRTLAEKGGKPVARFAHTGEDGITIDPLYTKAAAFESSRLGRQSKQWVRVATYPDANTLATAALKDVQRGVTGVEVRGGAELNAGLDKLDLASLDTVVRGGVPAAKALLAAWSGQGVAGRGNLGLDLLSDRFAGDELADLVAHAPDRALFISDTRYHHAGATEPQSLAAAVATGVAALRRLTQDGLAVDHANAKLEFDLAIDPAFFGAIAKIRAFRVLWARVLEASGATSRTALVRVRPSARAFTQRDPWVNLLRNTATCFAGAVGGADAVVSAPFDAALGDADDFSRRIARNTQTVLDEESHLGQVSDPAGGSYMIESLTREMAQLAWSEFQAIEAAGGMAQVLQDGTFAKAVEGAAADRAKRVATRKRPITGVSEFANPDEAKLERAARPAAHDRQFPLRRDAAPFEAICEITQGQSQPVFLANLGAVAEHTGRAGFARNVFAAGGFGVLSPDRLEDPPPNTRVACICGTDAAYESKGPQIVDRLRKSGVEIILLAGRTELPGVDHNIYFGCDVLKVLSALVGDK